MRLLDVRSRLVSPPSGVLARRLSIIIDPQIPLFVGTGRTCARLLDVRHCPLCPPSDIYPVRQSQHLAHVVIHAIPGRPLPVGRFSLSVGQVELNQ